MKFSSIAKFSHAASLAAVLTFGLAGCGDNSSSSTAEKPAIFLHNVTDAGQLYLDGPSRPYGRINFSSFGNGSLLDVGDWSLQVKDVNDDDSADEDTLLDTSFSVADTNEANLFALVGKQADNSIQLVSFTSAFDKESDRHTNGGDDSAIYINLAHMHPGLDELTLYVLKEGETVENSMPDATLGFGKTSEDLVLKSSKQQLVVKNSSGVTLFDSGVREIKDELTQSLIIAESAADTENLKVFYFYGSSTNSDEWRSNGEDAKGQVRIFNAIYDAGSMTASISHRDDPVVNLSSDLAYGLASSYETFSADEYTLDVQFSLQSEPVKALSVVKDGVKSTVIFTGRLGDDEKSDVLRIEDRDQSLATTAQVTFVHLGYKSDEEQYEPFDVHLVSDNQSFDGSKVDIESINYKESGIIREKISGGPVTYSLYVKAAGAENLKLIGSPLVFTLSAGDNVQVALIQDGASAKLVKIN
jgi:hypothetical protein